VSHVTRRRSTLIASALIPLAIAMVTGLVLFGQSVSRARHDLLRQETNTAVELLREVQMGQILDSIFPGRWILTDEQDATLDQAIVYELPSGVAGKAAVYDADSWYRVGTLHLSAPADRQTGLPLSIVIVSAVALLMLGCAIGWWVYRPGRTFTVRIGFSAAVLLLLVTPLLQARGWSRAELAHLTDQRLQVAVRALELVPDLSALSARPGGVTQLTGLQFVLSDPLGGEAFSTLP